MDPNVSAAYLDMAFDKMLDAVEAAGAHLDERPFGDATNAIGAIAFHCCEVCEFWLGHVALGRPSTRDREAEFSTRLPLDELRQRIAHCRAQTGADLADLAAGKGQPSEIRAFLECGESDESIVLHLVEELFQHIGQMDITLDVLRSRS